MPFTLPNIIKGTITNGDNMKIKIKNKTSGDELITITDDNGKYVVDAANFTNGYTIGDTIQLIIDELPQYTENITIENGDIRING